MSKQWVIDAIEQHQVFAIIRGVSPADAVPTVQALIEGGITLLEVTFDRKGNNASTLETLRTIRDAFRGKVVLGAGTVTSVEQVQQAHESGAVFIVSPDCQKDVITETNRLGMVSLPGAMTATEAVQASNAGADFIKLFPGGLLGPDYVSALCAPLSDLKFVVVGGVNADNLDAFAKAGAVGFGIGSNLVNKNLVAQQDFDAITTRAREFVMAVNNIRKDL